eukprot:CAMPEP_0172493150 /NCGR_PEP_ID=MMETSP1066-20121228/24508_1 /TAXON_ID=671091 /ORGANISM="Coscinodiscus wailesii, Strain CCMP2513" /LENGTH=129 /DNA_ID=CAMNT_0013263163 /DNA_START=39 /DNA_END=425 /DNA_ORIENTATION=+
MTVVNGASTSTTITTTNQPTTPRDESSNRTTPIPTPTPPPPQSIQKYERRRRQHPRQKNTRLVEMMSNIEDALASTHANLATTLTQDDETAAYVSQLKERLERVTRERDEAEERAVCWEESAAELHRVL